MNIADYFELLISTKSAIMMILSQMTLGQVTITREIWLRKIRPSDQMY